jgi:hypothetical protein
LKEKDAGIKPYIFTMTSKTSSKRAGNVTAKMTPYIKAPRSLRLVLYVHKSKLNGNKKLGWPIIMQGHTESLFSQEKYRIIWETWPVFVLSYFLRFKVQYVSSSGKMLTTRTVLHFLI